MELLQNKMTLTEYFDRLKDIAIEPEHVSTRRSGDFSSLQEQHQNRNSRSNSLDYLPLVANFKEEQKIDRQGIR